MNEVVADTHAAIWYFLDQPRLSTAAIAALDAAPRIILPSICIVEVIYLVEKGRIAVAALQRLESELADPAAALTIASLDFDVAKAIERVPRALVPDLPDRIIAATALVRNIPVVSRDRKIQSSGVNTIW